MAEENTNQQQSETEGQDEASGSSSGALTVNQQIVDAVTKTNDVMSSAAGDEAAGISFQKVAQAAALSVQDSTDYLRNIMSMAAAAQGVCLQKMIAENKTSPYDQIMEKAQDAVTEAEKVFKNTGDTAADVVKNYPASISKP